MNPPGTWPTGRTCVPTLKHTPRGYRPITACDRVSCPWYTVQQFAVLVHRLAVCGPGTPFRSLRPWYSEVWTLKYFLHFFSAPLVL